MYKPFTKEAMKDRLPKQYFLVRQKGIHPGLGRKYIPIVVQLINGLLYTPENELDPVVLGATHPIENPFEVDLEWMELPE